MKKTKTFLRIIFNHFSFHALLLTSILTGLLLRNVQNTFSCHFLQIFIQLRVIYEKQLCLFYISLYYYNWYHRALHIQRKSYIVALPILFKKTHYFLIDESDNVGASFEVGGATIAFFLYMYVYSVLIPNAKICNYVTLEKIKGQYRLVSKAC